MFIESNNVNHQNVQNVQNAQNVQSDKNVQHDLQIDNKNMNKLSNNASNASNVSIKYDKSADMFLFVIKNDKNEVIATVPSFISMMKRIQRTEGITLDIKA